MAAYYNEHDPFAAAWLRELIKAGHIAPGDVDERSIEDVLPIELAGYTQCHFFAGIGVWSYALRRAGWPDDRPVWTGSCPCQPFSAAGKGGGFADERHLWPAWFHLIGVCKPSIVLGEQVASKDGLAWFDLVHADMEAAGYAIGAGDLCAAGVGAPHIRQRLWFVAMEHAALDGRQQWGAEPGEWSVERGRGDGGVGHPNGPRSEAWLPESMERQGRDANVADHGGDRLPRSDQGQPELGGMADAKNDRNRIDPNGPGPEKVITVARWPGQLAGMAGFRPGPTNGHWRDADWLFCRDGKWRPVEPGTFPLAHGASARVGRLRGYGNAINAEAAQAFIESVM
jgi:DNA (cytosine-5)-methyltransferase 1